PSTVACRRPSRSVISISRVSSPISAFNFITRILTEKRAAVKSRPGCLLLTRLRRLAFALYSIGLRRRAEVRFDRLKAGGESLAGLFVAYGCGDYTIVTVFPVRRGRYLIFRCQLKRIDHAK